MATRTGRKRIPLDELFIPQEYQRPFYPKWAQEIADDYRPELDQPITVSDRNGDGNGGGLAVLDGQHRMGAYLKLGKPYIVAEVWKGLSVDEEADLFASAQRKRKSLTPLELWKARVVSGGKRDPLAVDANNIVEANGFRIGKVSTRAQELEGRDNINSVGAVEWLYKRGVLALTLETINLVWRRADDVVEFKATSADMLRGLGVCIAGYENRMTDERLEKLKLVSPAEILRGAYGRTGYNNNPEARANAVLTELRSVMGLRGKPKVKDRISG
jgi:hypothetical protein